MAPTRVGTSGVPVVTRFAPSPTGLLHPGHAWSASRNVRLAEASGGRFLLRIEDIDAHRCRSEYVEAILEDLAWMGIEWPEPPLFQSERLDRYEAALDSLYRVGLVYRCFQPALDLAAAASAPHRAPKQLILSAPLGAMAERDNLAEGRPYAWRLSLRAADRALGSLDDLTFVEETEAGPRTRQASARRVRGEDMQEAAGLHVLLGALLGYKPRTYVHHALVVDSTGRRLSKRDQATSIRALRTKGLSPDEIMERAEAGFAH